MISIGLVNASRTALWAGVLLSLHLASVAHAEVSDAFSNEDYAFILETYVNEEGRVDYKKLKADRSRLDTYIASMGDLDPKVYDAWCEKTRIAFWVNAYNARTLQLILDHYPIKSSWTKSFLYPKNSIRQIDAAWTGFPFKVMGRERTLDTIEHQILRREFKEPRIHVALVCAANGCPFLRTEPYEPERLDGQLDEQARTFLKRRHNFRIDTGRERIGLSSIFKWFGADFVKPDATGDTFQEYNAQDRAVLLFISTYVDDDTKRQLETLGFSIDYLDYDWELNER